VSALERAAGILEARAHGAVRRGAPVAPFTSYRLGGPAGVLVDLATPDDLHALSDAMRASGAELLIVGRGSNMLVSDRGFDGIVARLGAGFRWSRARGSDIEAGAAMPLPALATLAMQHDLTGLEFAVAIPASLGGAVRMNAGAHGREIAEVLASARVFLLDEDRSIDIAAVDAGFAYRHSALPDRSIVVSATVRLEPGTRARIVQAMNEAKEWRRTTQPINLPNGGSVFKNPAGDKAGRLIEVHCGKGMRVGGASVSDVHANFIVAGDDATADDVYTLMRRIQRIVRDDAGVQLEPELKLIGTFEEVE